MQLLAVEYMDTHVYWRIATEFFCVIEGISFAWMGIDLILFGLR